MKKWIAVGLSVGAGVALVWGAIIGGILWYSSRATPWNTDALVASGGEIGMTVINRDSALPHPSAQIGREVDPTGFRLSYVIENTTSHDITLSQSATLMTRRGTDGALDAPLAPTDAPLMLFVPARQRVMFHVQISYACSENGWDDWKHCFAHLFNEADGLVVIDKPQHLQLRLPKPYWSSSGTKAFVHKP